MTRVAPTELPAARSGHHSPAAANRLDLDMIGAILGTDKSSIVSQSWDYLRHYDSVFHPFRDDDINVIEVGVAGGHSLRLWQWYFSAARIIGVDIMPTAKRYAGGRATVEIGSQADVFFLRKLCKKYPPTIFIDDGSHLAQHNIITFEAVFPNLLAGGLYVVEDMALHLGTAAAAWQTDVPRDSPAYFLDLARSCLARHHMEGAERVPKHLIGMVDSVSFINSAAIIRKRGARAGLDEAIGEGASYLAAMKPAAEAYDRLALYVARHGGTLRQVETACEAAIEAGSRALPLWCLYADTMLRTGRERDAAAALSKALAMRDTPQRRAAAALLSETGLTQQAFRLVCDSVEAETGRRTPQQMLDVLHGFTALGRPHADAASP
jgi:hypothetical protein